MHNVRRLKPQTIHGTRLTSQAGPLGQARGRILSSQAPRHHSVKHRIVAICLVLRQGSEHEPPTAAMVISTLRQATSIKGHKLSMRLQSCRMSCTPAGSIESFLSAAAAAPARPQQHGRAPDTQPTVARGPAKPGDSYTIEPRQYRRRAGSRAADSPLASASTPGATDARTAPLASRQPATPRGATSRRNQRHASQPGTPPHTAPAGSQCGRSASKQAAKRPQRP